jgi:hypothetical protein
MKTSNKVIVQQARLKWIETMSRRYPNFNASLWERNSKYRVMWPQPTIPA